MALGSTSSQKILHLRDQFVLGLEIYIPIISITTIHRIFYSLLGNIANRSLSPISDLVILNNNLGLVVLSCFFEII